MIKKIKKFLIEHRIFVENFILFCLIVFFISGTYLLYREGLWGWDYLNWGLVTWGTGDVTHYEYMASGQWDLAQSPYIFRPLMPILAYLISLTGITLGGSFLVLNAGTIFLICWLVYKFLRNFEFDVFWSRVGVLLVSGNFFIPDLAGWPNVDLGNILFGLVIIIGLQKKSIPILIGGFVGGVLVRESIIFYVPVVAIWFLSEAFKEGKTFKDKLKNLKDPIIYTTIAGVSFLLPFLMLRNWEFNYNYDFILGSGEFPNYYEAWLYRPLEKLYYLVLSLNVMWLGLIAYLWPPFKWKKDKWFFLGLYGILGMFGISLLAFHVSKIYFSLMPIYLAPFMKLITEVHEKWKNLDIDEGLE